MNKTIITLLVSAIAMVAGVLAYKQSQHDFQTLDGEKIKWSQLEGQWVVVNYFAEWCAPCLREIPELNEFSQHAKEREGLKFYALSYDALTEKELKALVTKYDIRFPVVKSPEPKMPNNRPESLPATYLISPQGEVVKRLLGEQTNEKLQKIIGQLKQHH